MAVTIKSKNPAKGVAIKYSGHLHSGLGMVVRCATLATRAKGKKACNTSEMYFRSISALLFELTRGLPMERSKGHATTVPV